MRATPPPPPRSRSSARRRLVPRSRRSTRRRLRTWREVTTSRGPTGTPPRRVAATGSPTPGGSPAGLALAGGSGSRGGGRPQAGKARRARRLRRPGSRHRLVRQRALPAVQGRRRRGGPGHDPAGRHALPDRGPPRAERRCRGRRLLPAPGTHRRRERRPPARVVRAPQGHELRVRARGAPGGRAAERRAGLDPRGALAGERPVPSRRACRGTTCEPASAHPSSIPATTTLRAARASRASSSRPPTSSRRAAGCGPS